MNLLWICEKIIMLYTSKGKFNWGIFGQQIAFFKFRTNKMTKREITKLALIEFLSKLIPNTSVCWLLTASTLLLMSKSLISLIFWFSLTTSSIFLSFYFSSCISISFWCLIYWSSSFFYKYSTFSWRI